MFLRIEFHPPWLCSILFWFFFLFFIWIHLYRFIFRVVAFVELRKLVSFSPQKRAAQVDFFDFIREQWQPKLHWMSQNILTDRSQSKWQLCVSNAYLFCNMKMHQRFDILPPTIFHSVDYLITTSQRRVYNLIWSRTLTSNLDQQSWTYLRCRDF